MEKTTDKLNDVRREPLPSTSRSLYSGYDPLTASATELSSIGEEYHEHDTTQDNTSISTIISCNCDCSDGGDMRSGTPTDFLEDDDLFDLQLMRDCLDEIPTNDDKKYKNGTRKSLTFTNERMRQIERENYILLQKIMSRSNGPSKSHFSYNNIPEISRTTSAAVNRRKQQRQIDIDNQVLCRKLESIRRKKPTFMSN